MHQNGALGIVSEGRSGNTNFDVSLGIDAPPATALPAPTALNIASTRIKLLILLIPAREIQKKLVLIKGKLEKKKN